MATKTISIDVEAYRRLKGVMRRDESFSRVIKRVVRPRFDVEAYLAELDRHPIGDAAATAVCAHEKRRHVAVSRAR